MTPFRNHLAPLWRCWYIYIYVYSKYHHQALSPSGKTHPPRHRKHPPPCHQACQAMPRSWKTWVPCVARRSNREGIRWSANRKTWKMRPGVGYHIMFIYIYIYLYPYEIHIYIYFWDAVNHLHITTRSWNKDLLYKSLTSITMKDCFIDMIWYNIPLKEIKINWNPTVETKTSVKLNEIKMIEIQLLYILFKRLGVRVHGYMIYQNPFLDPAALSYKKNFTLFGRVTIRCFWEFLVDRHCWDFRSLKVEGWKNGRVQFASLGDLIATAWFQEVVISWEFKGNATRPQEIRPHYIRDY